MMSHFTDFFLFLSNTSGVTTEPNSYSEYNISLTTGTLTDSSRNDPYAPFPVPRALVVSVFQPAICDSTVLVPYMPDDTAKYQTSLLQDLFQVPAEPSIFLDARLTICSQDPSNVTLIDDIPILLFSPGYTIPRHYYNFLASAIARKGFTVITIDHPYDANIITYPDGHSVYNPNTTQHPTAWKEHLPIRAVDASFIIDQLNNATAMAELLPNRGHRPFPTDRIAMLGHSLGGAASVIAAGQDPRILGAINWDGTFVVSPPQEGISQPVLLVSRGTADDVSWPATWPLLKGPKLWVGIEGAEHLTFSDVPVLLEQSGVMRECEELGSILPVEMVNVLVSYTTNWMDGVFARKDGEDFMEGVEFEKSSDVCTVMKDNF